MNRNTQRKILTLLLIVILAEYSLAQVTIGSGLQPSAGSLLDLKEENTNGTANSKRGLLLPRVTLSTLTPETGELSESIGGVGNWDELAHTGLMVYNVTNTLDACNGGAYEGLYTWNGNRWLATYSKKPMPSDGEITTDEYQGANSYIVGTNKEITIPVERAYKIWTDYAGTNPATGKVLNIADANGLAGTLSAEIVWQDMGTVNSISIRGLNASANLVVNAGSTEGNALVRVLIGGKVLWMWHIWIINDNIFENANSYIVGGKTDWYMDRFLGAKTNKDIGLYYQWGRNVPIQKAGSIDLIDATVAEKDNLTNAIQSEKFIRYESTASHDWYSSVPKQWDDRWGDTSNGNTKKSPFDPCPYGWRLPVAMEDESPWPCWGREENIQSLGKDVFSGYRANGDGSLDDVGKNGYVWIGSPHETMAGVLYYTASETNEWDAFNRANGMNVRCIKEK